MSAATIEMVLLPEGSVQAAPAQRRGRILPQFGWASCQNDTGQALFVYGTPLPDVPGFESSLYLLPSGMTTPARWDAKGFLIPRDRFGKEVFGLLRGPVAVKYCDFRRYRIRLENQNTYLCRFNNGVLGREQPYWPIPQLTFEELLAVPRRCVTVESGH